MSLAILEAQKGLGFTNPNPAVGAVIVKDGIIISTGFHAKAGEDHAERDAIKKASPEKLQGATLYSTLQPCCHHGKTPPCTDIIIQSGIKTVIYGSSDIDERVKDISDQILLSNGIEVISGILKNECDQINTIYFFNKQYKRPFIIMKAAMTLDGKIATQSNDSKWISNEKSRAIVQKIRSRINAIAVGGKTFQIDKPRLNCRLPGYEHKTIHKIVFSNTAEQLSNEIIINNELSNSSETFLQKCNENSIDSILVEGGSGVYTWFLENNLVDQLYLFYKPSFMGKGINICNTTTNEAIGQLNEFLIKDSQVIDNNLLLRGQYPSDLRKCRTTPDTMPTNDQYRSLLSSNQLCHNWCFLFPKPQHRDLNSI